MTKTFNYSNPVEIVFGNGRIGELNRYTKDKKVLLITSHGFRERGIIDKLGETNQFEYILDNVRPNPTLSQLNYQYETIKNVDFDLIVALGGGSVMDTAKVLSLQTKGWEYTEDLIKYASGKVADDKITPIIGVPTTAGSGSELTPWATVWDDANRKKYSLHLKNLWFKTCICDPEMTYSIPMNITIQSGLDALSHALESIWNINANPITRQYAVSAAKRIIVTLPKLIRYNNDSFYRQEMMFASMQAALAFSNTQTSIAHAMSYYMTLERGIPHGIASSFTLPAIADAVKGRSEEVDNDLLDIFGEAPSNVLRGMLNEIGVSHRYGDYGIDEEDWNKIEESLSLTNRTQNSIVKFRQVLDCLKSSSN
ncbi:phosphonoacetaldehyde reductase [Cohnella fermenti]|uniref:Phosphonoacetaldehyde reductase n=1 Tax=Cohnella fermenti TaxID=2565925 RepID=A0A4S4BZS7_9BACL|nr:phosphonoacetaldehyde reductase [Cohnella fermenti]THF80785.1 phosphonoacetaldehyde reductase [Cohnella fermenti]